LISVLSGTSSASEFLIVASLVSSAGSGFSAGICGTG
jgi:hypothetical protein